MRGRSCALYGTSRGRHRVRLELPPLAWPAIGGANPGDIKYCGWATIVNGKASTLGS